MDAAIGSDSGSTLSRTADTTLTEQLSARFAERIRQRLLAPGTRLPSVRDCARRHRSARTRSVAAYDQLLALGLVDARKQRGFFVRELADDATPANRPAGRRDAASPRLPLPISATSLIRGMFQPPGARRCRRSAPCRPNGSTRRCSPARCARCRAARSSARCRCSTATRPASCACAARSP
jgi:DNA-binding transcriptional MocR family regulator